jgi:membrane fusion protein, multidrug efflux system
MPIFKTILKRSALACLAGVLGGCSKNGGDAPSGKAARGLPPVPVTVIAARRQDIPNQLSEIGSVRAFASVSIKSRVDGELARIAFNQGDEVKKGALIFEIDPRPFQAALDQAQAVLERDAASLTNALADMRRTDALASTKAVSASEIDANRSKVASLKATLAADQAAVETAKLNLSFCSITSPVTGRIGMLLVDEGNMVKNNDTILAVVNQLRPIYVDFSVPEQSLPAVRAAAAVGPLPVQATIPELTGQGAEGQLAVINNEVDTTTGTLLLRAVFPNKDEMLWPGQFVNVDLTLSTEHNAVVVPTTAIQLNQKGGRFVCVVQPDDTVAFRPVEVGTTHQELSVIKKGIQAGERIVTSGQLRLMAGSKVKVVGENPEVGVALTEAAAN